jgi:diguanylate cyclase (GGDEF)-like protein/PAS domain S-box-containing protein
LSQENRKPEGFSRSPLGVVAVVASFVLIGEFLIMVLIEGVLPAAFKDQLSTTFWEFIDPIALTIILAPALYYWVLRPMRVQQAELRRQYDELCVAAATFEAHDSIIITDANKIILKVNRAFTDLTGYTSEEAIGKTPAILKSHRHDPEFYKAMWAAIRRDNTWKGEIWNRHKSGEVFPMSLAITAVIGAQGKIINYVAISSDISARKAAEDEIKHLAFYDALTRLPNRRLLLDRLRQLLASMTRVQRTGALLFVDLDKFKSINDARGHNIGDLLLQQVGERLTGCVRNGDTVARLGGDEFVVLLDDLSQESEEAATQVEAIGVKVLAALNEPYLLGDRQHHCTPSIGVTLFNENVQGAEDLLRQADMAMYQVKATGRNSLRFFDPAMQAAMTARVALEADLRTAIREGQFVIHYQAQMSGDRRLTGAEVLVRWQQPGGVLVLPDSFIPLAEETGLIVPLGHWVLKMACTQLALWSNQPDMAEVTLSVNVSARQFRQPGFVDEVVALLNTTRANPHRLKFELTESLLLLDIQDTIAKMGALKALGIGFSLDDFGTGYSSLSYLKQLPLEQLKIDQCFVHDVTSDGNDAAIAKSILVLAQSLGLQVVAEGVETAAQLTFLADAGCDTYQGFFLSRPLPIDEFEKFAAQG